MTVESGQQGGCQCGAIRYRLLRARLATTGGNGASAAVVCLAIGK